MSSTATSPQTTEGGRPWSWLTERQARPLIAALALIAVAYSILLKEYVQQTGNTKHLEFALIVPLGSLYLLWVQRPTLKGTSPGASWIALGLFAMAGLLLFDSFLSRSLTTWSVAFLLTTAAAIHALGGWGLFRQVWKPWALLMLMVRPPFGLDIKLITMLQLWVSVGASTVLDSVLHIPHVLSGNEIVLADGQKLFVAEACSGVNSLFATGAVLVFAMFMFRRVWLHTLALFGLGFVVVMVVNVFRIVSLTWAHWFSKTLGDFSDLDIPHTIFGLFCFVILLALLFSCDALLFIFVERMFAMFPRRWLRAFERRRQKQQALKASVTLAESPPADSPETAAIQIRPFPWLAAAALFGLIGGVELVATAASMRHARGTPLPMDEDPLAGKIEHRMPKEWDGWKVVSFANQTQDERFIEAKYSSTWSYQRGDEELQVHIHRPYVDFHQLQACYSGTGWTLENLGGGLAPEGFQYVNTDIERSTDGRFILAFTFADLANERWLPPPVTLQGTDLKQRISNSLSFRWQTLSAMLTGSAPQAVVSAALVIQRRTTRATDERDREETVDQLRSAARAAFPNLRSSVD